jgi:hypothetical protein
MCIVRKTLVAVIGGICGATIALMLALGASSIAAIILGGMIGPPKFTGFDAMALSFWAAVLALPVGALYGGKRGLDAFG